MNWLQVPPVLFRLGFWAPPRLFDLNPNETAPTPLSDIILRAPAGASLPPLVERVRQLAAV